MARDGIDWCVPCRSHCGHRSLVTPNIALRWLSELREAAERERIAGDVIAEVAALGDARETFTAAASTLVAGVRQVVARVPGVMPDFEPRLASIVGEIPLAVDELVSAARRYASNIAAGSEPLPRPMALAPKPESPPDVARIPG
jgi:hypothetical protein